MKHSTTCNISIRQTLDISSIAPNMSDDDLLYLDGRSLKVVTPALSLSENQRSL